ncbi:hypothetical protein FQS90_09865 [Enterococcus casseliflavus]|uniref:dCTP deaminase n=1 Tax=Enterococcus sp. DIV0802b TaxID=2774704 RepID=UPI001A9637EE|nr:hypothetical protein [Enterococcus casseliflavus]MBO1145151.1 hypothetical protein [Enterococcus casseliflavus]
MPNTEIIEKITGEGKTGTLNDSMIKELSEGYKILIEKEFSSDYVKQCCYELRASNIYYKPYENESSRKVVVGENDYILIKPNQLVVIISKEKLNIPNNIVGKILTKGKLFSIGLLPVNTYADPGFRGNMGIVFSNISNNYIKIYPDEAIAKIEFSKLIEKVSQPYSGQHGYESEIWPIPVDMILSKREIRKDKRISSSQIVEISEMFGEKLGAILKRILWFEKGFIFSMVIYVIVTLILLGLLQNNLIETVNGIWVGVITNCVWLLGQVVINIIGRYKK